MKIKAIFFDLDGTLLPMNQDLFIKTYLGSLVEYLSRRGHNPEAVGSAIWKSIKRMMANNGEKTNEKVFWDTYVEIYGAGSREDEKTIDVFYKEEFDKVSAVTSKNPMARDAVETAKSRGFRVILATNPVFPEIATKKRIRWAGLSPEDFEYITSYENSSYSKPCVEYYREILEKLSLSPEECLMIGNDTLDDMIALDVGMNVFLLTDCLINQKDCDITRYPRGGYPELIEYISSLS